MPGLASGPPGRLWNSVSTIFTPLGYVIGHWKLFMPAAAVMYNSPSRSFFSSGITLENVSISLPSPSLNGEARLTDCGLVEEVHDANAAFEVFAGIDDPLADVTGLQLLDVERGVLAAGDVVVLAAGRTQPTPAAMCGGLRTASRGLSRYRLAVEQFVVHLVQRGQIVEDPERTTMGRHDEVGVL